MNRYIYSLTEPAENDIVGGKGSNLSVLIKAGFAVPPGFCLTTGAYREFLDSNQLEKKIFSIIEGVDLSDIDTVRRRAMAIQKIIIQSGIPNGLQKHIIGALAMFLDESQDFRQVEPDLILKTNRLAVRSSATAEDLPGMSFAGQHDTYLNVSTEAELFSCIKNCWASLFSERAIAYRCKNEVDHKKVLMAVIVQILRCFQKKKQPA